jgi:hypothetical protein
MVPSRGANPDRSSSIGRENPSKGIYMESKLGTETGALMLEINIISEGGYR